MTETKVFCNGDKSKARVLVIGHDPRLQGSNTIAEYCFFADYYFRPISVKKSEVAKYKLAESLFSYVAWLTSNKYSADELIITNLCNRALKRYPKTKGKTVLIPEEYAREGLANINDILKSSQIELIIAMSQQVNYLLQKLGFYSSTPSYMEKSIPRGKSSSNGYYEPVGKSPFLEICGNRYHAGKIPLYPVLHVKQFPFKRKIKDAYENAHCNCINSIKEL
jgi:hypothetical protein